MIKYSLCTGQYWDTETGEVVDKPEEVTAPADDDREYVADLDALLAAFSLQEVPV